MAEPVLLKARRARARGVPAQLPPAEVEVLPFFGRTWYVHGVDYGARRAIAVVLASIGLAVACAFEVGLLEAGSGLGAPVGRWLWRAGWAALLVASLVRPARALVEAERRRRAGLVLRPGWGVGSPARRGGGAGIGAMARARQSLAAATLVLGVVLFFGWFVVFVISTLQREYGVEHDARLRLQRRHPPMPS